MKASNPWQASPATTSPPQFSADQLVETKPDSVSNGSNQPSIQHRQQVLGKAFANNLSDVIASLLPSACPPSPHASHALYAGQPSSELATRTQIEPPSLYTV